ncbi:hypothetical protein COJ45_27840 [Bacillus cereus]|nr:hypothetical protein COJ45_27840 [Bacillus cereus]
MEKCFVPYDVFKDDKDKKISSYITSAFGEIVEMFIRPDYCINKGGCQPFNPKSPGPTSDFFDFDSGVHRCTALNDFLRQHHPSVGSTLRDQCLLHKKGFRFPVPDIITYQPPGRTEFYEIKPDSNSGVKDGRDKLNWFDVICADYGLPYVRGSQYSPSGKVLLWDGTWFGSPSKVYLRWRKAEAGLLLYQICVEVSLGILEEMLVKALIKSVVLALIILLLTPAAVAGLGLGTAAATLLLFAKSPLQGPVGENLINQVDDVRYVQRLLNDWRGINGFSQIQMTGTFDDETKQAITDFQQKVSLQIDGCIDINGPAINALERANIMNLGDSTIAAQTIVGNYELVSKGIGYDFNGWPEDQEGAESNTEESDPSLDPESLAKMGLQDYLDYIYI